MRMDKQDFKTPFEAFEAFKGFRTKGALKALAFQLIRALPDHHGEPFRQSQVKVFTSCGLGQFGGKADMPRVPPSHLHSWVRISDPRRNEIHLRQESKFVLEWLRFCASHMNSPARSAWHR